MADKRTLAVYDAKASEYAKLTVSAPDAQLLAFMALVPPGGRVLDLGCGPGTAAAHMRDAGLVPDAIDAAAGMVAHANAQYDLGARVATFDDVDQVAAYDGIWANFSLLHADRADLPRHLQALATALKPGGAFHIGMKTGTGAKRDPIDRLYTYVTADELQGLLAACGLDVIATESGEEVGLDGVMAAFVIMRARKNA